MRPTNRTSFRERGEKQTGNTSTQTTGMDFWTNFQFAGDSHDRFIFRPSLHPMFVS
jgi:hypothetical protein